MAAMVTGAGGLVLALHHPSWPGVVTALFVAFAAACAWRPDAWLFLLPAALPWMNFAPWTGWIVFDEFDLVVLAVLSGGYGRIAAVGGLAASAPRAAARFAVVLLWALAGTSALALYRGLADAGWALDWYQGYADPLNSVRVFKGPMYVVALWPLLRAQIVGQPDLAQRRLCLGMLTGLTLVCVAVLSERAAYPGLWDFSEPYRVSAMFWEMHVGGAAIDAYLVMAMPFVAWALWRARCPLPWLAAALLALASVYACLTTFSRGVYVAVGGPLLGLVAFALARRLGYRQSGAFWRVAVAVAAGMLLVVIVMLVWKSFGPMAALGPMAVLGVGAAVALKRLPGWRSALSLLLSLLLLLEVVAVFGAGSFMLSRLESSRIDAGGRLGHWRNGASLLVTPADWIWGLGLGRLPDSYSRFVIDREFSGTARLTRTAEGRTVLQLSGPVQLDELGGLFSLTQRVPLQANTRYRIAFDMRAPASAEVWAGVCEIHLIYERECQWVELHTAAESASWRRYSLDLDGPDLQPGAWYAPRRAAFMLSVATATGGVQLDDLVLTGAGKENLLRNGDFAHGLSQWFPVAQYYYLPWHIDNLYLEWLIERGIVGLVLMLVLAATALRKAGGSARRHHAAPFVAASLCGALTLGLVSSVMDVPRVAFLFFLLLAVALAMGDETGAARKGS